VRSLSLRQVARATGGTLEGSGRLMISGIGIDSRSIKGQDLFVALEGERYDGHAFLENVSIAGVKAVMVREGNLHVEKFRKKHPRYPVVLVQDTLRALGDLAAFVREGLQIRTVGITGSSGKTCTKDLLVSALRTRWPVAASPGSFNNEVGIPLTVFGVEKDDRFLVAEMAARAPGDIGRLVEIVEPEIGIITNVGITHLELFKSQEGVASAKAELARSLPESGKLFLNADNNWSSWIARRTRARVVRFGYSRGADYRATGVIIEEGGCPSFTLKGHGFTVDIRLPVPGRHQVENAVAAAACAAELGLGPDEILEGFAGVRLTKWRMEVCEAPGAYTVINDSYNASPQSMSAALEALKDVGPDRRTVAVLGYMAELGGESRRYHLEAGRKLVSMDVDILVTVGKQARDYAEAAVKAGLPRGSVFRSANVTDAAGLLSEIVEPGDVILVKASRVMGLESVAEQLMAPDFSLQKVEANA